MEHCYLYICLFIYLFVCFVFCLFILQRVSKRKTFNARVSTPGNVFSEDNMLTFSPSHFDWRSKGVITAVKNQGILADSESRVVAGMFMDTHTQGIPPILDSGTVIGDQSGVLKCHCQTAVPVPVEKQILKT